MAGVPKVQHPYNSTGKVEDGSVKAKWWLEEDKDVYRSIFSIVKRIKAQQNYRDDRFLFYAQLYSNAELLALKPGQYARTPSMDRMGQNRVTLNVVKSCIDTAASKIAKAKTRPIFLTQGGDWNKKQRAKKLTKFMDGWFDYADVYPKGQRKFVDSGVWGLGGVKMFKRDGQVCLERALPNEIIVDEYEGMYGEPRQMHQLKYYHKDVLVDAFPKHEAMIRTATSQITEEVSQQESASDMVAVVESWHLRSGKNASDGRHTISIDNCTLEAEAWDKDYFPFVFYRWAESLLGFDGKGMVEELVGIQIEINKILRTIQRAQHLVSVPQVWLQYFDNNAVVQKLNNEIGGKYYYQGNPPIFMTPPAMSPEVYQHLERLYQKAYEIVGVSMMSANSKKPSGVTADVALRTLQDIETERFMLAVDRYEDCFMQIADMAIDMMGDLVEEKSNPKVNVKVGKFIESIDWRSVKMDKDDYVMRKFPMSALPTTPTGRIQAVQEWIQAGMISAEDGMELLDFPDTEKMVSIKTAAKQVNEMVIDTMLETGEYTPPEPEMNLELARSMAQNALLRAKLEGAPDDRLEHLRTFMDDCKTLIDMAMGGTNAQAGAQMTDAGGMMPGGAPLAVPEAPPTSDLLPLAGAQGDPMMMPGMV